MSTKISALAPALPVLDSYEFVVAAAPDNYKVYLPDMLYRDGDEKVFGANGSTVTFTAGGEVRWDLADDVEFTVISRGDTVFRFDGANFFIQPRGNGLIRIATDGVPVLELDPTGPFARLLNSGGNAEVSYNPGDINDWDGGPLMVHESLDRIAAAVAGLLGVPIP